MQPNWERRQNKVSKRIFRANLATADKIEQAREALAAGTLTRREMLEQHPRYVGFVPCRAGDVDFVMFTVSDDIVAKRYLLFGEDAYETKIVNLWCEWSRDATMVYDIGAYTGLMSILATRVRKDSRVHLFEPMERTIERAKINLIANRVKSRVTLHSVAASDTTGTAEINIRRGGDFLATGSSLHDKRIHGGKMQISETRTIRTAVIDDLLPDGEPDVIKIDVEGHELACLRGLERTIKRSRPKMVVEVWEHTRDEVLALLDTWGYDCTRFERKPAVVNNYRCVPRD